MNKKINVIITGASGMVGEGVLIECLHNNDIEKILVVGRRPCGTVHPKLTEIIHPDFYDLSPLNNRLKGYDACFFCLGVSSVGKKEPEYYKMTYTLTMHFAQTVANLNSDMTFCYISGSGTDSSEKGRLMWARVKGKTENDLTKLPFRKVYNFRPGFLKPTIGAKNILPYYKYFNWLYPVLRLFFGNYVSTLAELGNAMINSVIIGYDKQVLEVRDILLLAKK